MKVRSLRKQLAIGLAMSLLALLLIAYRGVDRSSVLSARVSTQALRELPLVLPTPLPYPKTVPGASPPEVSAKSVVVIDTSTATVLFGHNPNQRLNPASTTKIMTALVVLEQCALDSVVKVTALDVEDTNTQMGLFLHEEITVEALLYGLLLNSGNDASLVLAQHCGGSVQGFVDRMNEKAHTLFLTDTHFTNPAGLDQQDHYTTARDLARLTSVALRNPHFARIVATKEMTVANVGRTRWHTLVNKNLLLGSPGVIGVKTGWTQQAGECLVTALIHGQNTLVSVVLGSADRFGETRRILNWARTAYYWEPLEASQSSVTAGT